MDMTTFRPRGTISIQQALTRIKYSPENATFSIGFCRATKDGKARAKGQIVWYDKALYGASKDAQQRNGSKAHAEKQTAVPRDFKKEGVLPIHNYETKAYKTPLIASIMFFEGMVVKHPDDGNSSE